MAFPFQLMFADMAEPMGRTGLRVLRPEPIQQGNQMRPVGGSVTGSSVLRRFQRQIGRLRRAGHSGKRPRVQLVRHGITQRVFGNNIHMGDLWKLVGMDYHVVPGDKTPTRKNP